MKRTVIFLLVLGGCLDFDAARQRCVERGDCIGTVEAPKLTATVPANQMAMVPVAQTLSLTFSKAMDKQSIRVATAPVTTLGAMLWSADDLSLTVQPAAALDYATPYTVTVSGRSRDGAPLGNDATFSFTTEDEPDTTAPTLLATVPASGTSNVPVETHISLTFSEAMSYSTVTLMAEPSYFFGTPTWSTDSQTATYAIPPSLLEGSTQYVVQVDGLDVAGNALTGIKTFSFSTRVPPDTTAPVVLGASPVQGSIDVSVTASPSVTFSEPMNAASVSTAFAVVPAIPGGCSILPDATGTLFTCNHGQPLAADAGYTVTIGTGAQDGAGNALALPFVYAFSTGAIPDTTPPTILSTSPDDGTNGQVLRPAMRVTFSEQMDQLAVQGALTIVQPAGVEDGGGSWTWSDAGTQVTRTWPGPSLPYGTQVIFRVGTSARDLAGNGLASAQSFTFQVVRLATVNLTPDTQSANWDDRTFTGNGNFHPAAGIDSTTLYAGDVDATGTDSNKAVRAALSFDLSSAATPTAIPNNAISIIRADLTVHRISATGSPPTVYVIPIYQAGSLTGFFSSPDTCPGAAGGCSASGCNGTVLCPVGTGAIDCTKNMTNAAVDGFAQNPKRVTFRIDTRTVPAWQLVCLPTNANGNGVDDNVRFSSTESAANKPQLAVQYTYP